MNLIVLIDWIKKLACELCGNDFGLFYTITTKFSVQVVVLTHGSRDQSLLYTPEY